MNHTDFRSPAEPALRLPRRAAAPSVSEIGDTRAELAAELESLCEREANLRAYEERLRTWQAQLDAQGVGAPPAGLTAAPFLRPTSRAPFARDPALEVAWEKLHRARALLEAEQKQMCDDRLKLRDVTAALQQREAELVARETQLAERELRLAAAAQPAPESTAQAERAGWSLTQAPFRAAKAIFRSGS